MVYETKISQTDNSLGDIVSSLIKIICLLLYKWRNSKELFRNIVLGVHVVKIVFSKCYKHVMVGNLNWIIGFIPTFNLSWE